MPNPTIPLAMIGEKGLKEVYNIGAKPIIGIKKVRMQKNGSYREMSLQVNGWQLLAASLIGGLALALYLGQKSKTPLDGLPWPMSEFGKMVNTQATAAQQTFGSIKLPKINFGLPDIKLPDFKWPWE